MPVGVRVGMKVSFVGRASEGQMFCNAV